MSDIAIHVDNLSKKYRLGTPSGQDRLTELIYNLGRLTFAGLQFWRRTSCDVDAAATGRGEFWALRDVSFEIHQGEVVGIVGRNGAGKSTLLKILSRITEPTAGRFGVRGHVGSLLEVGTGFHPELTGRENIYLNGAFLGMSRQEIRRNFDAITAFAEIDDFLDTPVKRYSSGMQVRLGFAVAAHLDPDILIVDEALAVGDAAFQKKCLAKMQEVATSGRTVLFVSHNMLFVSQLCRRAIWLDQGHLRGEGPPSELLRAYAGGGLGECHERNWSSLEEAPGNDKVRLLRARIRAADGMEATAATYSIDTPLLLEFEYWNAVPGLVLNPSVVLYTREGVAVFNTVPVDEPVWHGKPFPRGRYCSSFRIPAHLLNDETYVVTLIFVQDGMTRVVRFDDLLEFKVVDNSQRRSWFGKRVGLLRPRLDWSTTALHDACEVNRC